MYKYLTKEQRVIITYILKGKKSKREIALEVGCNVRTIYYELNWNRSQGRNESFYPFKASRISGDFECSNCYLPFHFSNINYINARQIKLIKPCT